MRFLTVGYLAVLSFPLLSMGACGGGGEEGEEASSPIERADPGPPELPTVAVESWSLSETPLLEIGLKEGEDPYQLHRVRGSVRLNDGRIVVLNAGSQELRYFDAQGVFLQAVGGRGEGPGEFESPVALRKTEEGDLQVWDRELLRGSLFGADGAYLESFHLSATRGEMFPGDDWLMGQNWIVSPVPPGARGPIRRAVEAMPPTDSTGILRLILVSAQGRLWTPDVRPPVDVPVEWSVYDLQGRQVARVTTPARFQPHEIGEDYLTGLFQDDLDLNYVRLYGLIKPPGSPSPGPGLDREVAEEPVEEEPSGSIPSEATMASIRSLLKVTASLEEIHYSENYTYTFDSRTLFGESRTHVPQGLQVDLLFAGEDGWAGMVTDSETGGRCVMAYGFYVPMGWQPGSLICL